LPAERSGAKAPAAWHPLMLQLALKIGIMSVAKLISSGIGVFSGSTKSYSHPLKKANAKRETKIKENDKFRPVFFIFLGFLCFIKENTYMNKAI
jgi:hypothetical protein